jgi:hypothetical protein
MFDTAANIAQVAAVAASAITFGVSLYVRTRLRRRGPATLAEAFEKRLTATQLEEQARRGFRRPEGLLDLELTITVYIRSSGEATVSQFQRILNTTNKPFSRIAREIWFQYSDPALRVVPTPSPGHSLIIQPIHRTDLFISFACLITPSVQPGDTGDIAFDCLGAKFVDNLYWRQRLARYTRQATIKLHLERSRITEYNALLETNSGLVSFSTDTVLLRQDAADSYLEFTLEYLKPNEVMTLTWKGEPIDSA